MKLNLPTLVALAAFIVISASSAKAQTKDSAKIQVDEMIHDFGTLHQNDPCTYNFKVTNMGNIPLIISNTVTSCGCDVPTWSREPILPGKSAFVNYRYDSNRLGHFEKTMTITSNSTTPSLVLRCKGNVLPTETEDTTK